MAGLYGAGLRAALSPAITQGKATLPWFKSTKRKGRTMIGDGIGCRRHIMQERLDITRPKLRSDHSLSTGVACASGFASPFHLGSKLKNAFGGAQNKYR